MREMDLEIEAVVENLNTGREDLVGVEELEDFGLTPGHSSCNGHGSSSCSSDTVDLQ